MDVTSSVWSESVARAERRNSTEQYSQKPSPSQTLQSREKRICMAAAEVRGMSPRQCAMNSSLRTEEVDLDLDEVDGHRGDLGDHDAAESVGYAGVGVAELELGVVVPELADPDAGEALVRRAGRRTVHLAPSRRTPRSAAGEEGGSGVGS